MKKIILGIFLCASVAQVSSQSIGIGTAIPNPSAQLEISSATKGTLITRMTTAQRKAIVNPVEGLLVYDTEKKTILMYGNKRWQALMFASDDQETSTFEVYTRKRGSTYYEFYVKLSIYPDWGDKSW
jgi:hypothetical protein